jgi:hypothetical protein
MGRGYLVTCPDSDLATQIGSAFYLRYIINPAKAAGIPVIVLAGDDANFDKFWEAMDNPDVFIATGVGHGNPNVFTGQYQKVLISVTAYNKEKIQGKCIEHTSCSTGAYLLKLLAQEGCKETKGSNDVYVFYYSGNADPTEDVYAKSFLTQEVKRYSWLLDTSDKSDEEKSDDAENACVDEYNNQIDYWRNIDPEVAQALQHDRDIMCKYRGGTAPPPEESWICRLLKWLMGVFGCKCPEE